jgi:hypothetical protein
MGNLPHLIRSTLIPWANKTSSSEITSVMVNSETLMDDGNAQAMNQLSHGSTCEVCAKLTALCYTSSKKTKWEKLGKTRDLVQSECSHVELFRNIKTFWKNEEGRCIYEDVTAQNSDNENAIIEVKVGEYVTLFIRSTDPSRTAPQSKLGDGSDRWDLAYRKDVPFHPGTTRVLDEHYIDVDVVRG